MKQESSNRMSAAGSFALAIMLVVASMVVPAYAAAGSSFMERNTDRTGADFRVFQSGPDGPRQCARECASDDQCKAWTYVAMGNEGPNATCHLKVKVPPAVTTPCCVSGVNVGSSEAGRRAGY